MRKNKGAVIFICLWVLALLSIFAIGIASRVASEMQLARRLRDTSISLYLAKAALNQAKIDFLQKQKKRVSGGHSGYNTSYMLQGIKDVKLGIGSFTFNFIDQDGLIDINKANLVSLQYLPGITPEIAAKIIEKRQAENFQLREELLLVEGVSTEIFYGIKNLITTFGYDKININTAPEELLGKLGLDSGVIAERSNNGSDGQENTEDDGYVSLPEGVDGNLFTVETRAENSLRLNVVTQIVAKPVKDYSVVIEKPKEGVPLKIKLWQEK